MDDYDYLYKLVLVGDSNVGKTSLLRCLKDQEFSEDLKATIGVEFGSILKRYNEKTYKLQIWDTAGQERFRALSAAYYRGAVGAILVYDITSATSFKNLEKWRQEIRENCDPSVNLILVGNKSDEPYSREVSTAKAQAYAQQNGMSFLEASAKNSHNVHESVEILVFGDSLQPRESRPNVPNVRRKDITGGTTNLPLVSMDTDCDIYDTVASVNITQVFKNSGDTPQELIVGFPIDEFGSVCKFEGTKNNGDKIVGKVLEKTAATNKYDDAISEGKTAILLEECPGNVFKASVGMLPPGETMTLQITYVTELQVHRKREFKFAYKTMLDSARSSAVDKAGVVTVRPKTSLEVRVHADSNILNLRSYSHDFTERRIDGREGMVNVQDRLLEANFEMYIRVEKLFVPRVFLERNDETASTAIMVTTVPQFPPPKDAYEIVFVIDRSGSMSGEFWNTAQTALQLFIRSLPAGCYFNVVGFGSTFVAIFEQSVLVDATTFKFAISVLSMWGADLGGTAMTGPLNWVYKSPIPRAAQSRRIILLTDGQPDSIVAVLQAAAQKITRNCKLYCMGIGSGVNASFLNDLTRIGKGYCEMAPNADSLALKVIRQLKRALDLDVKNASVTWKNVPPCKLQDKEPEDKNSVFVGGKLVLYSLLENKTLPLDQECSVLLEFTLYNGEKLSETISIDPSMLNYGTSIHAMAARHFIRVLLQSSQAKNEVVRLSTTYGVSSIYASFVAVEAKASGEPTEKTMGKVEMEMPSSSTSPTKSSKSIAGSMSRLESEDSAMAGRSVVLAMAPDAHQASAGCCGGSGSTYTPPDLPMPHSDTPTTICSKIYKSSLVEAPKEHRATLPSLVTHQNFDGSWEPQDVALIFHCADKLNAATFALETRPNLSDKEKRVESICLATAIVVAFLEIRYISEVEKWEMLVEKSYEFLEKNIATIAVKEHNDPEKWVAHAKSWLYYQCVN